MVGEGQVVAGRYRLVERIAEGGMGVVWRAWDERLHRTVAVKQLEQRIGVDGDELAEARTRAMREGRIAARVQHPNAVAVYDVVEDAGLPWLIMEYVPSRSLAAVLRERGALPPDEVAEIGAQVAAALAAAHAVGVVHRDVTPANVLLADGTAKITDYGISRAIDDVVVTATGVVPGTPAYLAPETAQGEQPSPASDVFALGSTLYTAVEGDPPFGRNDNALALLHTVAAGRVRPPTRAGPLTAVLHQLLQVNPADRPTMTQARDLMAAVCGQRTLTTADPATPIAIRPPADVPTEPPPRISPNRTLSPADNRQTSHRDAGPSSPSRWGRARRLVVTGTVMIVVAGIGVTLLRAAGNTPAARAPSQTHPPTAQSTTAPASPIGGLAQARDLLMRYYGLLPANPTQAWELLSPHYRVSTRGFGAYQGFWATITSVQVHDILPTAQPDTVTGVVTFLSRHGVTTSEHWRFTVHLQNGQPVIYDAAHLPGAANTADTPHH